jgi:hypothetical protein
VVTVTTGEVVEKRLTNPVDFGAVFAPIYEIEKCIFA